MSEVSLAGPQLHPALTLPITGDVSMPGFASSDPGACNWVGLGAGGAKVSHPVCVMSLHEQKGHPRFLGESESNSDSPQCLLPEWKGQELL